MKRALRCLCLLLLAVSTCCSPGCLHPDENPSYLPFLHPDSYGNYDPFAVRLAVEPGDRTNPVRHQHVIIATVYDKDNKPRRGRRIEWRVEGVGSIIQVDGNGKIEEKQKAVSMTNKFEHKVTRGNDNPLDDFVIRPGQTWCVVSSTVEGDTHVSVMAPEIFDWGKRILVTTVRWVDADYIFPLPAQVRTGSEHVLTTRIIRHTDKQPLAGYRVRYKIDSGPPALFVNHAQEFTAVSDLSGNAQVAIAQMGPAQGVNHISMEVIRPPDPSAPSGSGVTLARGETTVEWLAPAIILTQSGPTMAVLGSQITYETTIRNVGRVECRSMTVTSPVSDALSYVTSNPPATPYSEPPGSPHPKLFLGWALGKLAPNQEIKLQATFKTKAQGLINSCASVVTEEGLKDEKCIQTNVSTAALKVAITGPTTAVIGQPLQFMVTVTNPGGGPLEKVLVTANFDEGLESETKLHTVNQKLLTPLAPQESRVLPLDLIARKVGPQHVRIVATASVVSSRAEAVVMVQQPSVKLSFEKPPKTGFVGKQAEWSLVLINEGDATLTNVVIRDRLPPELEFAGADQGGGREGGDVLWKLGQLLPRDRRVLKLTTLCKNPTKAAEQKAVVTTDQGVTSEASAVLEIVSSPPGLNFLPIAQPNPVQVGKKVTYLVKVSNSGQEPLQGVEIKAVLPPELQILSAKPPPGTTSKETIDKQVVTFTKVDGVGKDRVLEYTIEAEGKKAGDLRIRFECRTLGMDRNNPMVDVIPTTVFDTEQPPPPPGL